MSAAEIQVADDIVKVRQDSLIGLHRQANNLPLRSRKIRARLSGQYVSPFKGRGMEFDESRPYQPGDDIRSIDWRVTARTGRTHTKLYREERERPILLWVDYRRPMFFASRKAFKSVLAAQAAALLAWSSSQHGDRLGGLIFSEEQHTELRPKRGKSASLHFIQQLAKHPAWDNFKQPLKHPHSASASKALNRLRRVARPGSLIFLISDFRHMDKHSEEALAQLSRHSDLVMLFIHDPLEAQLPPAGFYKITDGENELAINTGDKNLRQEYQQRFSQHQQNLQDLCQKLGIFHISLSTDDDLLGSLQKGLGLRKGQ